ncbi:MAG: glycosyltransferase family 2 protein [Hyphomonadaceae bacterium]|nr:glycosyltransferase family 2 protein [Hyphomonadaceae bacterium]
MVVPWSTLSFMEENRQSRPLIAVCVCTRGRPIMLRRCLESLVRQDLADAPFAASLFVVDNDAEGSARPIFDAVIGGAGRYVLCEEPGIPFARNAAIDAALTADAAYIAFIDDDEVAPPFWLTALFEALRVSGADAVQGGVRKAPAGADLAVMSALRTSPLRWESSETLATCNLLFDTRLVRPPLSIRFDTGMRYTGGSDREFFMHAHKKGARMIVVHGVDVLEEVAAGRETLAYECARAFAAGNNYVTRMVKHEPFLRGRARIGLRALERGLSGTVKVLGAGVLALLLQTKAARRQARKGCANVSFAAGCISPALGIRAHPYAAVQGH